MKFQKSFEVNEFKNTFAKKIKNRKERRTRVYFLIEMIVSASSLARFLKLSSPYDMPLFSGRTRKCRLCGNHKSLVLSGKARFSQLLDARNAFLACFYIRHGRATFFSEVLGTLPTKKNKTPYLKKCYLNLYASR